MSAKVLITGGSGLIGSRLTDLLLEKNYDVYHLGRQQKGSKVPSFVWKPDGGTMDKNALRGCDAVIHLAGASIAGRRWTASYKNEILASRIRSTRLLLQEIKTMQGGLRTFICASAIGFYGNGMSRIALSESHKAGDDFLAEVVNKWEAEAEQVGALGTRVCTVRTGIVLSSEGGALPQMATPIRFGVGAPLGSGQQIVSWVHIDDLCMAYIFLLENQLSGPFNITAPHPVTNKELTVAIARQLGKPLWLPNIPSFVLRVVLGEMAEAVLTGNAVSSEKIVKQGFAFDYQRVEEALKDLFDN